VRCYFLICFFWFCFFASHTAIAQAQQVPSGKIEIIADGKRYESVLAYKREQIRKILIRALSSMNLHEFSEEELCDIIKEVRIMQGVNIPLKDVKVPEKQQSDELLRNQQKIQIDAQDFSAFQMQKMLRNHYKENPDSSPLLLDSDKVKNFIIESGNP